MMDAIGILVVDKKKDSMPDVNIIFFPEKNDSKYFYSTKNIDN